MTKAIISIPADFSCNKLISLREILASADPNLQFEFQPDTARSRAEVKAFVEQNRNPGNEAAHRFTAMSTLQSALFKFESVAMNKNRPGMMSASDFN